MVSQKHAAANHCSTETAQFYKTDPDCTFYLDLFHASTNHLTSSFSCSKSSFLSSSTVSNPGFLLSFCIYSSYLTNLTPSAEFQVPVTSVFLLPPPALFGVITNPWLSIIPVICFLMFSLALFPGAEGKGRGTCQMVLQLDI